MQLCASAQPNAAAQPGPAAHSAQQRRGAASPGLCRCGGPSTDPTAATPIIAPRNVYRAGALDRWLALLSVVQKLESRGFVKDIPPSTVRVCSNIGVVPKHSVPLPFAAKLALGEKPSLSAIASSANDHAALIFASVQDRARQECREVIASDVDDYLATTEGSSLRGIHNARPTLNLSTADGAAGGFTTPQLHSLLSSSKRSWLVGADDYEAGFHQQLLHPTAVPNFAFRLPSLSPELRLRVVQEATRRGVAVESLLGDDKFRAFIVLSMGWDQSPGIFCCCTGILTDNLNSMMKAEGKEYAALIYYDDQIAAASPSFVDAQARATAYIASQGGKLKEEKSKGMAPNVSGLLGRVVDMPTATVSPTVESLFSVLTHFYLWLLLASIGVGLPTDRAHSLAGRLQWVAECTYLGRLFTGILWRSACKSKDWRRLDVRLTSFAGLREEIQWWISACENDALTLDRTMSEDQDAAVRVGIVGATPACTISRSDAGKKAAAALVDKKLVWTLLTKEQCSWSSQARELLPMALAAEALGHTWVGKVVVFVTDSQAWASGCAEATTLSSTQRRERSR